MHMKKMLVIQSRTRPEMIEAEQGEYRRAAQGTAELYFISALDQSLSWSDPARMLEGHNGVIFGGSGEYDLHNDKDPNGRMAPARAILARVAPLINYLTEHDVPTLGICFGHQLIGEELGGGVSSDELQAKVGSFEVGLTEKGRKDPLFGALPEKFMGQYGHHNSLTSMPKGGLLLAQSPTCKFSALRYGAHVYTTQFHPELTAEDVRWKLSNSPGYLPEGNSLADIIQPSVEASTLIPRFIQLIA